MLAGVDFDRPQSRSFESAKFRLASLSTQRQLFDWNSHEVSEALTLRLMGLEQVEHISLSVIFSCCISLKIGFDMELSFKSARA